MRISGNRGVNIPVGVWLPAAWLVLQFVLLVSSRAHTSPPTPWWAIFFFTVFQAGYLLPGIFASARGHPHRLFIWLVTLFLGWTGIGWIVAMIWSAISGASLSAGMTTVRAIAPMSPNRKPVFGGGTFLPQGMAPKSFLPPNGSGAGPAGSFLTLQPALAPEAAPETAPETVPDVVPAPVAAPQPFTPSAATPSFQPFVPPGTPAPKSLRVELAEKALAELDAQKAEGKIAEADYQARRAELLAQL